MRRSNIEKAVAAVDEIILTTDWNHPSASPAMTVKAIEAKAELLRSRKKLGEVLKMFASTD